MRREKMISFILLCVLATHAFSAELPVSSGAHNEPKQDLKAAESSKIFSWSGDNRYPTYVPNFPNYWWYNGNGNQHPNYFHQNPGFGNGYPNNHYPNYYGFGSGGFGGYPGGYGYPSGFGNGYNGFTTYSGKFKDRDNAQKMTARGGYLY